MSSGSSSSTTIVKRLPDYAIPFAQSYLARAETLSNIVFAEYTPSRWADQNSNELTAIENLAQRGTDGDATIQKGDNYLQQLLDGDYLPGDTKFNDVLDSIHVKTADTFDNSILNGIGASVYAAGDLLPDNLAQDMSADTVAKYQARKDVELQFKNYSFERKAQESALHYANKYGEQDLVDAEILRTAGLHMREWNQGRLEIEYLKWYESKINPVRQLEVLGNAIRALVGTQEKTTQRLHKGSPAMGIIGGIITGVATGFMIAGTGGLGIPLAIGLGAATGGAGIMSAFQ